MSDVNFWFTLAVVVAMTVVLATERIRAELAVFTALLTLLLAGVISPGEAFIGFSNGGMLSVAFLYVTAAALESTGLLQSLSTIILGRTRGRTDLKVARLVFPTAAASAFLNNTPLVAMFIPMVKSWCRRHAVSSSKFLIPLSYGAVLGGTLTLIGTSTNLVVHGQLIERGFEGFSFFELGRVGLPVCIVGLTATAFFLFRWLPDRKEVMQDLGDGIREFAVQVKVGKEYFGVGKTVEAAGLRHLRGLFLFQIQRKTKRIAPVTPAEVVQQGDRLFFTGLPATIVELQKQKGLHVVKDAPYDLKNYDAAEVKTFEAVISAKSPLVGQNVRESNFRSVYNGVILAIHRSGERINKKIGDVVLQQGDTLLILAPKDFQTRWYHSNDFYLVSASEQVASKPRLKTYWIAAVVVVMVTLVTAEVLPMVVAAASAAALLVLTNAISMPEALKNIDWGTLLIIASSFGIAEGLENSGVANSVAEFLVGISASGGPFVTIATVYFATVFYKEFITNNAAAALLFPVGMSVAAQSGLPVMPLAYAVALGASLGFAVPYSYQTNLMVYASGGYKFADFFKVGLPMDIVVGVTAVVSIYLVFF